MHHLEIGLLTVTLCPTQCLIALSQQLLDPVISSELIISLYPVHKTHEFLLLPCHLFMLLSLIINKCLILTVYRFELR